MTESPAMTSPPASPRPMSMASPTMKAPSFRDSGLPLLARATTTNTKPPLYLPMIFKFWIFGPHIALMICFGLGIEIAMHYEQKNNGFSVPQKNALSFFGVLSPQFLMSFFPSLLVFPLHYLWGSVWFWFRLYQPYIVLSRGRAPARTSVSLDYLTFNRIQTLQHARKNKHNLVYITGLLGFGVHFFQPLASSLFELRQVEYAQPSQQVLKQQSLGIPLDETQLDAFIAAVGYVEASVAHHLNDPPFVMGGHTLASFQYPNVDPLTVSTVSVNLPAVNSSANCFSPASASSPSSIPGSSSMSFSPVAQDGFGSSSSSGACTATVAFNASVASNQYGATPVEQCAIHGSSSETDPALQPVLLWFVTQDNGTPRAASVFCKPSIEVQIVQANVTVANATVVGGNVIGVKAVSSYTDKNNVTQGDFAGKAFNGVVFNLTSQDAFVQARASAINTGLPGAIFRFASLQQGGLPAAFDQPDSFAAWAETFYTRHLAIAAQSIYFVPESESLDVRVIKLTPRLSFNTLAAHTLAFLFLLTGVSELILHIVHRRARAGLYLTHKPGALSSIAALTRQSGMAQMLQPRETRETIERKLDGLLFRYDSTTGGVMQDDDEHSLVVSGAAAASGPGARKGEDEDAVRMQLLSPRARQSVPGPSGSSLEGRGGVLELPYEWEPLPELPARG